VLHSRSHPVPVRVDHHSTADSDLLSVYHPSFEVGRSSGSQRIRHGDQLLPWGQVLVVDAELQPDTSTIENQIIERNERANPHRVIARIERGLLLLLPQQNAVFSGVEERKPQRVYTF
jgi:hypothetical protein